MERECLIEMDENFIRENFDGSDETWMFSLTISSSKESSVSSPFCFFFLLFCPEALARERTNQRNRKDNWNDLSQPCRHFFVFDLNLSGGKSRKLRHIDRGQSNVISNCLTAFPLVTCRCPKWMNKVKTSLFFLYTYACTNRDVSVHRFKSVMVPGRFSFSRTDLFEWQFEISLTDDDQHRRYRRWLSSEPPLLLTFARFFEFHSTGFLRDGKARIQTTHYARGQSGVRCTHGAMTLRKKRPHLVRSHNQKFSIILDSFK